MQASYSGLISDHDRILHCSNLLLEEVARDEARSDTLVAHLTELARIVREHLAVENGVVALCDAKPLPAPWRAAWVEGKERFDALCRDWNAFLTHWTVAAVERDIGGFRHAATAILGRLGERVALESDALYAVALQTGAIRFR